MGISLVLGSVATERDETQGRVGHLFGAAEVLRSAATQRDEKKV